MRNRNVIKVCPRILAIYLEVKNRSKKTSEFLTLCPCLNLRCVLGIFGRFSVIPANFSSAVVLSIYYSPQN